MHSRLNIPAPAGVKAADAHGKTSTRQSNAELRLRPKRMGGEGAEKSWWVDSGARTVNRHRWVSVSALRRARETSLRNSAH